MLTLEHRWIESLQHQWSQADLRHDTFFDAQSGLIVTTDMLVEDVHFNWQWSSPGDVGWKALVASLSDIAATGGVPHWCFVSIGVPNKDALERLDGVYEGLAACCREYNVVIAGGDTVNSDKTIINITLIGHLATGDQPGRRHLGRPGDIIAISGPHGLSKAGLEALRLSHTSFFERLVNKHRRPTPQLALGQKIANVLSRYAMMDSSDGLADAVIQLGRHSNCVGIIDAHKLWIDPELADFAGRINQHPMDWVLYGGEDFELVVCMPPEMISLFPELTIVGELIDRSEVPTPWSQWPQYEGFLLLEGDLIPLTPDRGYQHFRE